MAYTVDPTNKVIFHIVDDTGKHATSAYNVVSTDTNPGAGGPLALASVLQNLTLGHITSAEVLIHGTNAAPGAPATGPFDRVTDKMQLVLTAADGTNPIIQLPTIKVSSLGPDGVHINPAAGAVVTLINALKANAVTAEGQAITGLQRGFRRRPPRLKKQ